MAGQKNNVVTYVFEGNILDLEQAIAKIKKELSSSMKALKGFQEGVLTDTQRTLQKQAKNLLKLFEGMNLSSLNEDQAARARVALKEITKILNQLGREEAHAKKLAAKEAERIAREKARAEKAAAEEAAQYEIDLEEAKSVHGRANAEAHAMFLENTVKELSHSIGPAMRDEIDAAIAQYRAIAEGFDQGRYSAEELLAATTDLQNVYKNYSETLRTLKNSYNNASRGIKSFNDLVSQSKRYIETMLSSITFWINLLRQLAGVIKQGIQYYSDYVESLNYLEAASGDAADAMLEFAKSQAQAFGLDPTQVNDAAAAFFSFAESMNFSGEQAALLSMNLTKLAQDLASLHNTDIETAMSKLRAALAGQSRALAIWGINVTDANMNEWLLSKGINKTMNQMNEATQAAARYAFIIERSSYAQGDLARTLQSPANQLRIFSAQTKLFVQNIGSLFTTVLMPLVKLINNLLTPINAFFQGLTSISAEGFTSSVGDASDSLEGFTDDAESAEKAVKGLTGLDEINQFSTSGKQGILGTIDEDIAVLLEGYNNLANDTGKLVEVFRSLGEAMAPIWAMFNNGSGISFITMLFEGLGYVLYPLKLMFDGLAFFFNLIPEPLRNFVAILSELALALSAVAATIAIVQVLMKSSIWKSFIAIIASMWKGILGVVAALKAKVVALFSVNAATTMNTGFTRASTAASLTDAAAKNVQAAAAWKLAIGIIAAAGAAAALIAGIVLAATSSASSAASSAQNQDYTGDVPALAKGGVVTKPQVALIGEGNYNEAVVPLGNSPQFMSMKSSIANEVVQGLLAAGLFGKTSQGSSQPVVLNIDGKTLAKALWPSLEKTRYQVGVNLK